MLILVPVILTVDTVVLSAHLEVYVWQVLALHSAQVLMFCAVACVLIPQQIHLIVAVVEMSVLLEKHVFRAPAGHSANPLFTHALLAHATILQLITTTVVPALIYAPLDSSVLQDSAKLYALLARPTVLEHAR